MSVVRLQRAWVNHTKEGSYIEDSGKTMLLHADKISDVLEDENHQSPYDHSIGRAPNFRVTTIVMDNGQ